MRRLGPGAPRVSDSGAVGIIARLPGGERSDGGRPRVLVAERIGDRGIELLRTRCDVELGFDWTREQLAQRIGGFDAILIRSATKLDAELLGRAQRLRAVGRAGVGIDNV